MQLEYLRGLKTKRKSCWKHQERWSKTFLIWKSLFKFNRHKIYTKYWKCIFASILYIKISSFKTFAKRRGKICSKDYFWQWVANTLYSITCSTPSGQVCLKRNLKSWDQSWSQHKKALILIMNQMMSYLNALSMWIMSLTQKKRKTL